MAFDYELILERDNELMNYLILRIEKRLKEYHHENLHFALIELPYYPHIKQHLNLNFNKNGVYFFIQDFNRQQFYLYDKPVMDSERQMHSDMIA
jgi:hypothetical protein